MKRISSIVIWGLLFSSCTGDDLFFQMRQQRTRCSIPKYDYRIVQQPATSAVVSETAVVVVRLSSLRDDSTEESSGSEISRSFISDDVIAGPAEMRGIAATAIQAEGKLRLTGTLIHTGGDKKHLQGGKVVVKMQCLTTPGESSAASVVVGEVAREFWIRPGIPQAAILELPEGNSLTAVDSQTDFTPVGGIQSISRVRVYLEYYPSR